MHIEHFQGRPMLLFAYCSICVDLSQETCETFVHLRNSRAVRETLRNENSKEMFAMTECYSASLCQAGQSGNNAECTSIEMSALPAGLTQLAWGFVWGFVNGIPKPYPSHHPGGTAKTSTCLFSATHFKIIPPVLQNFSSQHEEDPKFQLFWPL